MSDLDGQLRGLMLQHISNAVGASGTPFLDLAANQVEFANALQEATAPAFAKLGLKPMQAEEPMRPSSRHPELVSVSILK